MVIAVGWASRVHAKLAELKAAELERRRQGERVTVSARVVEGESEAKELGGSQELIDRI